MLTKLRQKSRDPSVNPYQRLIDPDLGMPDEYYMMDEIGRVQVLRKFKASQEVLGGIYCGTYEILYKSEKGRRFCLVMRRIRDEWGVPPDHRMQSPDDMKMLHVAEYYPGVMSRIYLKGLPEAVVQEIIDDFARKMARRKRKKKLLPLHGEEA